ncbi:2,3-bisphosphoglycerate-independent phosphoglycerate mutase [Sporotomaculum syntrophicum]|uniref:2,3-bisphosphoglycerate-independent phosphoglycerate mutase n=1 Tax=Sporotomaculum syntrophicum TaxID=182264 RepID=A0A9D3AYJ3_9FIRM|nr:2,3-bisphosphoglycerate-independent phosphoglycerate mutase [Sporotomaculum syntrophicum]KAF1086142.1 2,3-bisphosphoglycerate-independent phosphoglycerate mutase [Sporotomaculum syntrophicum]
MATNKRPLVLFILDGWGLSENHQGNAIALACKPIMDKLLAQYPHTWLGTSGEDVGLPEGQMGNSEVGHLNIGAGRVVYQELTRISKAIRERTFYDNPVLLEAVDKVRERQSALHLMGLLSDGGVHSHIEHLYALLELARDQGLSRVFVHAFLDGRDVPPANAREYIIPLTERMKKIETGQVATVMGRYYAMDRDRRWERTQSAYLAMVLGEGYQAPSALEALEQAYGRGETDEFVKPTVIVDEQGQPVGRVDNGDAIIFYNFRPDRARQITRAFVDIDFDGFERPADRPVVHYVCMTQYDKTIEAPVAFRPQTLINTLGEVLSYHKLKQLRLAETEKYAHVTFFFNGGVEKPNEGEDRILVPSPSVATYDLQPDMSAEQVTNVLLDKINEQIYDVIIVNYANPDMVGHTGILSAAIKAIETVDRCIGRGVQAVQQAGGIALITADHGNAENMVAQNGEPFTAHTTDPVPLILVSEEHKNAKLRPGRLEDLAPTVLQLLNIAKPPEMTGHSLLEAD